MSIAMQGSWTVSSGGAILLERASGGLSQPPSAPYAEDPKENHDGMLQ